MEIRHQRVNGYEMAYVETGSGDPLVLVHGSLCDFRYWPLQARDLAADYRVISVSLRHYYPERWDGSGDDFSPDQHAKDVAAFIDALDAGPVHLLGHSRGGYVALQVARRHPGRVRKLILADPAGDLDEGIRPPGVDPDAGRIDPALLTDCVSLLRRGDVDGALQHFVDTVHGPGTWAASGEKFRDGARDNAYTLLGQIHDRREPLTADMLARLRMPTLLIGGERSPQPFPALLDALEHHLPDTRRVTIGDATHGMNLERPEAFNDAVRQFLAQH